MPSSHHPAAPGRRASQASARRPRPHQRRSSRPGASRVVLRPGANCLLAPRTPVASTLSQSRGHRRFVAARLCAACERPCRTSRCRDGYSVGPVPDKSRTVRTVVLRDRGPAAADPLVLGVSVTAIARRTSASSPRTIDELVPSPCSSCPARSGSGLSIRKFRRWGRYRSMIACIA